MGNEKIPKLPMKKQSSPEEIYKSGTKYGLYLALKLLNKDKKIKEFYNYQTKLEDILDSN